MAINLTQADSALKSYYLDVVKDQLNLCANPFLAQIKQSNNYVYGKDVKKIVTLGVNGGFGAGTEDGSLPNASGSNYKTFTTTLKNLYGTIEITDKAIRASKNDAGAFVNLLTAEMENLVKASKYNFGRMLFGDGTGVLTTVAQSLEAFLAVDSAKNLESGMIIDIVDNNGVVVENGKARKIIGVDKHNDTINLEGGTSGFTEGNKIVLQGSYGNEMTGISEIFNRAKPIYGVDRAGYQELYPYTKNITSEITELDIQTAIDTIEERSNSKVNFIICSYGVRRALQKLFASSMTRVETVELSGGYKTMSYNGIPIVADKFCPEGTMYLLNTDDFTIHQLCDWQWLEGEDGTVLKQIPGKPVYTATLVKYADLMCDRICGQGQITNIPEA